MGWGSKAIEIRAVDSGHLDGVFMHKRAQKLRFLCERNDKVRALFACVVFKCMRVDLLCLRVDLLCLRVDLLCLRVDLLCLHVQAWCVRVCVCVHV